MAVGAETCENVEVTSFTVLHVEKYSNIELHTHTNSMCKYAVPDQLIKSLALSAHVVPLGKLCHCIPVGSYINL